MKNPHQTRSHNPRSNSKQQAPNNYSTKKVHPSPPTQVQEQPEITPNQLCLSETSVSSLPSRPRGTYTNKFSQTKLLTNLYKISFNKNLVIHIYFAKIEPNIQHDSTKKFNLIINSAKKDLKGSIGTNFVISGRTLYTCQAPKNQKEDIVLSVNFGTQKYSLTLKHVKKVQMDKISSNDDKECLLPMNFMNNLIKQFFLEMKYVEVGKSGKYINPNSKYLMASAGIILFNGYQASISMLQDGLYLRVDGITRIVQDKSALDLINNVYKVNSHLDKDAKRNMVKQQLIGRIVVANYGNSRHWKIIDVIFDVDFDTTSIAEETNVTYAEYYKKNYGLTIKNKKQPLLKAIVNSRKKGEALLIPELLLISGLPDNFDQRKRRQISEKTIISPQQKLQKIQALISSFNATSQNLSSDILSQSLGVTISDHTESVNAISLSPPILQLGGGGSIEQNKVANFQLFNKPLYKNDIPLKIVAFVPDDYDFSGVQKLAGSTCKNFGISLDIIRIKIRFSDPKRSMQQLQNYIEDKNRKFEDRNLCWFILPGNQKSMYPKLKRMCINAKYPKISQMSLTSTLAKKGFASIVTKILIQAASKVGNVPWSPKISKNFIRDFIIIGIDICKDLENRKQSVVSYCCSLNNDGSQFHSNYCYQQSSNKCNQKIKQIIAECLSAYSRFNNRLPTEMIILKTGCSDSEKGTLLQKQISDVKQTLSQIQNVQIKLTYMIVDLASKQKFFLENRNIMNPYYGTLINSKVVGKNYDFYMISQHCNRGTVKPIHYEVIHTDSELEEGVLQQFIYSQCFNYMNWSGSIRVPGVLQYAKKLSKLASEHLNCSIEGQSLNDNLFFI